jgi:polyisoprenyl-teichoic acid--peptidoglycan teichoic acid transferase
LTQNPETTTNPQSSRPSRLGRAIYWLLFRMLPTLLLLSIAWTGYRVIETGIDRANANGQIYERRADYMGTATRIAQTVIPAQQSESGDDDTTTNIVLAQFSTNTPEANTATGNTQQQDQAAADAQNDIGSLFGTNTPQASPTPQASATPIPPTATSAPVNSTPFIPPTLIRPAGPDQQQIAGTAVPTQVPLIPREDELINIVLLGTDSEVTNDGTERTDTIIIVSVNTETDSVNMLSLPRDLFVYIPTPTMTRINTVYGIGENFGWTDGGWGLLRQTIFYNFGINVHYYAKVDFTGFEQIIDTLGGVEIAVECDYQGYYPVDEIDLSRPIEENYYLRTLPVGYYTLDGFDALWYARTRENSLEFDRGRRQMKLLRGIWRAALENGQLAQLPDLWSQLTAIVETNVPFDVMLGLLPTALELDFNDIEQFYLIYSYHTTPWSPPSGPFAGQAVQLPNYEPMRQLLTDFYTPPTRSQLNLSGRSIAVYDGSGNTDWDRVAAQLLLDYGFNAVAAGPLEAEVNQQTVVIDQAGEQKGNLTGPLQSLLNAGDVRIEPDAERTHDYRVIVGANYNSCPDGVTPVQ